MCVCVYIYIYIIYIYIHIYIYIYIYIYIHIIGPDRTPCAVLWRPGALDCRVPIPPEAWNGLTRNAPSLGFEPQTSESGMWLPP